MRKIFVFYVLIILLAGCASDSPHTPKTPNPKIQWLIKNDHIDPSLKSAINKFWQARQLRQWEKCYELEAPSVQESTSLDFYRLYHNGGWDIKEIQILKVKEKPKKASVLLQIFYESPKQEIRRQRLLDTWIFEKGKWYHQFHDPLVRPKKKRN